MRISRPSGGLKTATSHNRRIRSFSLRRGISAPQRRLLADNNNYCPAQPPVRPAAWFGNNHPLILDIGFGHGESLLHSASTRPLCNFIGIDPYVPGLCRVVRELVLHSVDNVRLLAGDAVQVLLQWPSEQPLQEIHIFFPDPWPKRRHHKRRLIQPDFVRLASTRLAAGGCIRIATDCVDYARDIHSASLSVRQLKIEQWRGDTARNLRPVTHYQQRAERLGNDVFDICLRLMS